MFKSLTSLPEGPLTFITFNTICENIPEGSLNLTDFVINNSKMITKRERCFVTVRFPLCNCPEQKASCSRSVCCLSVYHEVPSLCSMYVGYQ